MKKNKIVLTSFTAALLGLGFLFPMTAHADKFDDEIAAKEQAINANQNKITELTSLQGTTNEEITSIKDQLKILATTFSEKNKKFSVLEENYQLFLKNGDKEESTSILQQVKPHLVKEETKPQFLKVMTEKKLELANLEKEMAALQSQNEISKETLTNNQNSLTALQAEITTLQNAIVQLKADQTAYYSNDNLRNRLVEGAYAQLGKPYVWGGQGPSVFDCSGLMNYLYTNIANRSIGSWTVPQESSGTMIAVSQARPGDLLFWGSVGSTHHVAMYIGNGQYIHAPQPGEVVKITSLSDFAPNFAVSVL